MVSIKEDKIRWRYYDESRPTEGLFQLNNVIKYNLRVLIVTQYSAADAVLIKMQWAWFKLLFYLLFSHWKLRKKSRCENRVTNCNQIDSLCYLPVYLRFQISFFLLREVINNFVIQLEGDICRRQPLGDSQKRRGNTKRKGEISLQLYSLDL